MKVYFDSSVLVAAFLLQHPHHKSSRDWVQRAARGEVEGVFLAHAAAETWAVVSVFPVPPRPGVDGLRMLTAALLGGAFTVIEPDVPLYRRAFERLVELGHRGGAIYDSLHMEAARSADAELILTWDLADFRRVAPDLRDRIRTPGRA